MRQAASRRRRCARGDAAARRRRTREVGARSRPSSGGARGRGHADHAAAAGACGAKPPPIRSRRRGSRCGTCRTSRSRSPTAAARRFSIAARRISSTDIAPDGWPRRSSARAPSTSSTDSAPACSATRLRERARRRGAGTGDGAAPLVFNPQGLEEFGATAGDAAVGQARWLRCRFAGRSGACARAADCIIATDAALESTVARHLQPRAGQMRTIPNGIDLVEAAALAGPAEGAIIRQRYGLAPGETVLLTRRPARVQQGTRRARGGARAARDRARRSRPTGWRWVIVGAGPFRHQVEAAVAAHGLESHTVFVGRASEAGPARLVRSGVDLRPSDALRRQLARDARGDGASTADHRDQSRRAALTRSGPAKTAGSSSRTTRADSRARSKTPPPNARGSRRWARGAGEIVEQEFSWNVLVDRQIEVYRGAC